MKYLAIAVLVLTSPGFLIAEETPGAESKQSVRSSSADSHSSIASDQATESKQEKVSRSNHAQQMRQQVRAALRAQATAGEQHQAESVVRLLQLRNQVVDDEYLSQHYRKQLAAKLHRRLIRLRPEIVKSVRDRQQRVAAHDRAGKAAEQPEKLVAIDADKAILAQWQDALGQIADGGGLQQGGIDNGEALVELIEDTICPDDWENNGGHNRIVYFGNLQALVVSATGQ